MAEDYGRQILLSRTPGLKRWGKERLVLRLLPLFSFVVTSVTQTCDGATVYVDSPTYTYMRLPEAVCVIPQAVFSGYNVFEQSIWTNLLNGII